MAKALTWDFVDRVTRPALIAAPISFLEDIHADLAGLGIHEAVARHDPAPIFDWLQRLISLQGISDTVAFAYADQHGSARWAEIAGRLRAGPSCPKLRAYWHFADCRYRKAAGTCAEPQHQPHCPLPTHPLRKGGLNQAAYSSFLFMRDVCFGDFVGWLDARLAGADPGFGAVTRSAAMRTAVLEPLKAVQGIGPKLWSMALAELLLGGDLNRERWVTTGASMIAIDGLMHNFMHRTGILHRLGAEHPYGDRCYGPGGCADIIEALAARVNAREFNLAFPACFPRFVQHAIWRFAPRPFRPSEPPRA